jgi:flagellar motor switch protein FliG
MINDYYSLSGLQKVAVLFSVVGEGLALSLVKGLSKTEVRKIRSTLQTMGPISFNVKKRVMEEFYFGFLSEDVGQNGTDGNAIHPFEFLKDLTDEQLFALVNKEDAPVIAMTLAQLEPEKRMEVVNKFDATLKGQVLVELGSLDDVPLEGVIEVGARLKEKSQYLPRTTEFSRGGAQDIAEMLGNMDANEQERYMQTLQNENPELQAEVKKYFLTFEDILEKFPDNVKRELFVAPDPSDLAIALKGLDQEVIDGIIDMLPQKKQAMYEPHEGPIAKKEVDTKRKEIFLDKAKEMDKDGTISIIDILGGGEMIE